MAAIGHTTTGIAGGNYEFIEFSIRGISKKLVKILVQKNTKGTWYVYKVTPKLVTTIGWSFHKERAIRKAREYIREEM